MSNFSFIKISCRTVERILSVNYISLPPIHYATNISLHAWLLNYFNYENCIEWLNQLPGYLIQSHHAANKSTPVVYYVMLT